MGEPYPGSNIFSLASGGAIYVRDPGQDPGGPAAQRRDDCAAHEEDWELILPYSGENERLFHIQIEDLLKVNGREAKPAAGLSEGRALCRRGKLPKSSEDDAASTRNSWKKSRHGRRHWPNRRASSVLRTRIIPSTRKSNTYANKN